METTQIRGAKVLLPSDDEPAVRVWPYPSEPEEERIVNVHFSSVDLTSHRLTGVTFSRCRFTASRLMGVSLSYVTMTDVLFEGCQFDYASWEQVKVTGDVAFVDCSFKETGIVQSDLRGAVFDDCAFGAEIESTKMSGTDLRGSDLSGFSGLASLHKAKVTEFQIRQLSVAMIRDLDLTVTELPLESGPGASR
ncbi:pentapeptide repeat-containing protein [Nocardiopsis listeri]|uniref:pentapeptide repeat-containing protein n=1 Tax=Nocardiopsis listeri TaxID=53440 RepID=UPI000830CFC0|nr:pentapeptide repeat-containing protein [Nocardiopsis listeri]